jgi:hypothetical protein
MELHEQTRQISLALRVGDVTHESPLLRKISKISNCSLDLLGEWLLKCAVERGASHYEKDFPVDLPADNSALSNEELGVALCLGHLPWNPMFIRAASQVLSAPDIDPRKVARLAEMERVEPILLHIAEAAARIAPTMEPWTTLRDVLPRRHKINSDSLPHWSRFVSQTGVTEFGGPARIDWLCRTRAKNE